MRGVLAARQMSGEAEPVRPLTPVGAYLLIGPGLLALALSGSSRQASAERAKKHAKDGIDHDEEGREATQ